MKKFTLSYPVSTVNWDGKYIRKVEEKQIDGDLDAIKKCGINELMLTGYTEEEPADFDMADESRRIGAKLQKLGMKGAQHHGLAPTFAAIGTPQEPVVRKIIRQLEFTSSLNAEVLVLHPGRIDGHHESVKAFIDLYQAEAARHGTGEIIKVSADNLHLAGLKAEKLGVKIALENVDRFEPLGNLRYLPELIKAADSDAVGYCLDSGHAHCCGSSICEWIEIMGNKLFTTHFHDNRGMRGSALTESEFIAPGGIDEHLPPGFGTIPWIDVIQKLWNAGYSRTLNFESGGWPDMEIHEGLKSAINFWRTCEYYAGKKSLH